MCLSVVAVELTCGGGFGLLKSKLVVDLAMFHVKLFKKTVFRGRLRVVLPIRAKRF